jgi:hypothetical protein
MPNYMIDENYTYPEKATLFSQETWNNKTKKSSIIVTQNDEAEFHLSDTVLLQTKECVWLMTIDTISMLTGMYPAWTETKIRRLTENPKCQLLIVDNEGIPVEKQRITPKDLKIPIPVIYTVDKTLPLPFLAKMELPTEIQE